MSTTTNFIRLSALLMVIVCIFSLAACSGSGSSGGTQAQQTHPAVTEAETKQSAAAADSTIADTSETSATTESSGKKTLVVYFSATGTTKGVAEQIASVTGADIYEITAAQTYTSDDLNWNDSNSRTTLEQNNKSVRPAISSETLKLDGYSTVFIGYPIWWGEEPRIMDTFVESYKFDGITMIPFCTSGGSGIGSSGKNLEANAKSGNWLEGERLSGSSEIEGWVKGLGLN